MFDWFWEFLYTISSTIFRLIDGLLLCANKLCGIDTINFEGEETDFLSYLLFSDEVSFAFKIAAILATMLLVIFTIFMIIRSIAKDKAEGTPAQIAIKAFKTLVMFFLVTGVIIAFMSIGNAFVSALYNATSQSSATPGTFLFGEFAADGGMPAEYVALFKSGELDYTDTSVVAAHMNISKFPFLFSWLAGGVVLFGIGSAMLVFVDRVISLVILYIVSPISLSTSVLDDGARFKLWRDQFLSKFIMGYGMIIAVNIYALICGLVMRDGFAFFPGEGLGNQFLDLVMKLLIIAGGALALQKAMALIGNLVSSGAGSNELRDSMSAGGLARTLKGAALGVAGIPFKPLTSVLGDAASMKSRDWGSKLLDKVGLGMGGNTSDKNGVKDPGGSSDSKNNEKANYGSNPDAAKNAIQNEGFKTSFSGGGNSNNNNTNGSGPSQKKNGIVDNAINGSGNGGKSNNTTNNNDGGAKTQNTQEEGNK